MEDMKDKDRHTTKKTLHFYDWMCPNCNFFIYGNKEYCKKCKIRNPKLPNNIDPEKWSYSNPSTSIIYKKDL